MNTKLTQRFLAAFAVAMLFSFGASAQILDDADWVEGGYAGAVGQEIDSVTVGATTRYFAKPDPYYHPNYVTPNWEITDGTDWDWFPEGVTSTGTADFSALSVDTNYIDITWGAIVGLDSIGVSEQSTLGCPGDTTFLKVQTLAEPTLGYVANADGTVIGIDLELCEGDGRLDGTEVVQAALTGIAPYYLDYALEIWTFNADSTVTQFYQLDKATPTAIASDSAAAYRAYDSTYVTTSLIAQPLVLPDDAGDNEFIAINSMATVYKYTMLGANGKISRKSNYLANPFGWEKGWTWYNTIAQTITIRVNPAPVTGPIYHISNMWAN